MSAGAQTAAHPDKAIWEPVNYSQDIDFGSVFFVTPLVGWVAGDHGTIIYTTDGGAHWTAQLGGDPAAAENPLDGLRFIDAQHGWATERFPQTDSKLLRTTDGEHWERIGAIPHVFSNTYSDYAFTSPVHGAALVGAKIFVTRNGGKDWRESFTCDLQGVECTLLSLSFVSADVGFALGGNRDLKDKVFIAKTINGGDSWTVILGDGPQIDDPINGVGGEITFTDALHGVLCDAHGQISTTSNGGATWHGMPGKAGSHSLTFADPQVAFSLYETQLSYTADGGARWTSRIFAFPTSPRAISAPRRDRVYVVSNHGMIYAYHVVPHSYSRPKALAAPIFGPPPTAFAGALEKLTVASSSLDAKRISTVQAAFDTATGLLPDYIARYRNLNLMIFGLRTADALPAQAAAHEAHSPRSKERHAHTPSSLAPLSAALIGFTQLADTALQNPPAPAP